MKTECRFHPLFCTLRNEKERGEKKILIFGNSPQISLDLFHEFEYTNTCVAKMPAHAGVAQQVERILGNYILIRGKGL